MKSLTTIIVVMMLALCPSVVSAQDVLQYTSTAFGISLPVPANAQEIQDDAEATVLKTDDEMYTFSAIPMDASQYDENVLATLAEAAQIDLSQASKYAIDTDVLEGTVLGVDMANGSVSCTGAVRVKETSVVFAITFVAAAKYVKVVEAALKTITINPDAINAQ